MIVKIIRRHIVIMLGVFLGLINAGSICSSVKASEEIIIYVSEGCPHCHTVGQFIDENGLTDNVVIKNVTVDDGVSQEFTDFLDHKDVPYEERGVPMMIYSDDEWIAGDVPIIDLLKEEFDLDESVVNESNEVEDIDSQRQLDNGDILAVVGGAFILAIMVGYGIFNAIDARRKN